MGKKSRRKGKEGELIVARMLYVAHYGEEPKRDRTVFVRTKPGVRQIEGDLIVPEDFAYAVEHERKPKKFYVEVKNRSICLKHLWGEEWRSIVIDAIRKAQWVDRHLLFIFKVHGEWWVLMNWISPLSLSCFRFLVKEGYGYEIYLMPFKEWLAWWSSYRGLKVANQSP